MSKLIKKLVDIAYKSHNGHVAGSLTALPIINEVYKNFDFDNDVFILSKGHASLALYAVLEKYGFKPEYKVHPDRDIENGIYCTTGSLGHGLPIAIGWALGKRLKKEKGLVSVLLGDGECQEGTTWESLLIAQRLNLANLQVIVDNNAYQALDKTLYPAVKNLSKLFNINVVSKTKGTGIKFFEEHPSFHVYHLSDDDYKNIMEELK